MRHIAGAIVLILTVCASAPAAEPPLHLHLLGPAAITENGDAGALKTIFDLPESKAVGTYLLGSLAQDTAAEFVQKVQVSAVNELAQILKRGLANESVFEITDSTNRLWRAAFRLPGGELKVVEDVLRMFVTRHGGRIRTPIDAIGSWSFAPEGSKRAVIVSHHGEWLLLNATGNQRPSDWQMQARMGKRPVPQLAGPMRLRLRSEMLSVPFPDLKLPHAFTFDLKVTFHKGRLRSEGDIRFDADMKLELEPFTIPTNTIRDPLITFSALRGFRSWLANWKPLRQWRVSNPPNQIFAWAQQDLPMHSLAAFPFPKAAQYLKRQDARVQESLNPDLAKNGLGHFDYSTNFAAQVLQGVPLMAPFVSAAPEPAGDWALVGTLVGNRPEGPNTNPPPAELIAQITNRPDLLYYHWEITEPRLQQVRMIVDLTRIFAMLSLPDGNNPFPIWLKNIAPSLGNTVTEVTRETDRRWKLTRTSDLGLTSLELALLSHHLGPVAKPPSPPSPAIGVPTPK